MARDRSYNTDTLIEKVNEAFGIDRTPAGSTYVWTVGPIRGGWQLNVTDDWHRWMDYGYQHIFNAPTLREALIAFLDYIEEQEMDPYKLRYDD